LVASNHPAPNGGWYPLKPEPSFRERIWGKKDLSVLYPSHSDEPGLIGEVWLTADDNRVANGARAGSTLGELCRSQGREFIGYAGDEPAAAKLAGFPLLIKFLFTSDKLSVQVHPSDSYARVVEGCAGKTEMWHVLRAEPGARLAIGFREELVRGARPGRAALAEAVTSGEIESMLNWREVRPGDTFFIPAGTVHAIGAGLVLCEIQQNSDITYRLYDYNRPGADGKPRELHLEKALDVIDWDGRGGQTAPVEFGSPLANQTCLAACRYFATEKIYLTGTFQSDPAGRFEIWIALDGEAEFASGGERVTCRKGEAVILPASAGDVSIDPAGTALFLRTYVPRLQEDIILPMRARGIHESQLSRVCFPQSGGAA